MVFIIVTARAIISASVMLVNIVFCFKFFQTIGLLKRSMIYFWEDLRVFSSSAKNALFAIIMLFEPYLFKPY
jgi:hypothetical protein